MSVANHSTKSSSYRTSSDSLQSYLLEIGRVHLLTQEQEISYGNKVQEMMQILQIQESLKKKTGRSPTCLEIAEEIKRTEVEVKHILYEGKQAKQKMITANLRLVVCVAKKYQKRNLDFQDLIQEGTLGLERAVEKFEPNRGYKFSTYAFWWIRQAMTRAIAQQSRTIRLPIHVTEKLNQIKKAQRELSQKFGRTPTTIEIAKSLNIEPAQIREYLSMTRQTVSLERRFKDNEETELQDMLADEGVSPDNFIAQESLRQELNHLLALLTPQQRQVLTLRFGLDGAEEMTFAQIGQKLNLSRERVRQVQLTALNNLRRRNSSIGQYLVS
jgi:RNA polymerase nonessential primary-like sigma factor